jgi:hypothetical protein
MTFFPDRTIRFIEVTLSSDQTISTASATAILFDTLRGTSGHGVSLPSAGTIRLSAGREYVIQAMGAMTISSTGDVEWRWWDTGASAYLAASDGAGDGVHYYRNPVVVNDRSDSMTGILVTAPSVDMDIQYHVSGQTGTAKADGSRLIIQEGQ